MGSINRRETRIWKLLLLIHLICYEAFFIITLSNSGYGWYTAQNNFLMLLLWTPLLLLQVGATYYYSGRADITRLEREAYREGFADAVRQLAHQPEAVERLALNDDGELVEIEGKRKRREV